MRVFGLAVLIASATAFGALAADQGKGAAPAAPWMDATKSPDIRADLVIARMTLDEKIALLHGEGWALLDNLRDNPAQRPATRSLGNAGFIPGIPRLGIPDLQMADAAVGVTHGSVYGRYSTVLPSGVAESSSWDLGIARDYGAIIGRELFDQGYTMSLGGGIDLAREPRNGRIFEYKGEDPILAGRLLGAEMKALQAEGVVGDIKHYAMNDQENGRAFVDIVADKRAMRESDLLAFEIGIKESGVGAVMCSYNLVNHDYACENGWLLNDVLKKDIGFKGFVLSDWGAVHSTVKAALAGLDMQMPEATFFGAPLKKAVQAGQVPMARLDDMVHRVLRSEFAVGLFERPTRRVAVDPVPGLAVAQRVAEQGSVLLKNANGLLPLSPAVKSIAVIGSHADVGVLSGGGSAQVDAPGGSVVPFEQSAPMNFGRAVWDPSSPLKAIQAKAANAAVAYDDGADPVKAAGLARNSDIAIVFLHQYASEGADVPSLSLPDNQDALVGAVAAANPHTIVVLETGGTVTMPWVDSVGAVLEAWYPGIRGGEAIANILFGDVNPSAKTPLTFARSEADLPHPVLAKQPPGEAGPLDSAHARIEKNTRRYTLAFDEGLKVGYKWYDAEGKQPLFPFGFGLSYTSYAYANLKVVSGNGISVTFDVRNTGTRAGAEIAQVYVGLPAAAGEPPKRLVAWDKIALAPGEVKTVTLAVDPQYLSVFNVEKDGWQLLPGGYHVSVGGSSRDTPQEADFTIGG
jgi:beta-glucosidase